MDESDRTLYSGERLRKAVMGAGYEIDRVETFLPMQNVFILRPAP